MRIAEIPPPPDDREGDAAAPPVAAMDCPLIGVSVDTSPMLVKLRARALLLDAFEFGGGGVALAPGW